MLLLKLYPRILLAVKDYLHDNILKAYRMFLFINFYKIVKVEDFSCIFFMIVLMTLFIEPIEMH